MLTEHFEVDAVRIVDVLGIGRVHRKSGASERIEAAADDSIPGKVVSHMPRVDSPHGRGILFIRADRAHAIEPLLRHDARDQDGCHHTEQCGEDLVAAFQPKERPHRYDAQQRAT